MKNARNQELANTGDKSVNFLSDLALRMHCFLIKRDLLKSLCLWTAGDGIFLTPSGRLAPVTATVCQYRAVSLFRLACCFSQRGYTYSVGGVSAGAKRPYFQTGRGIGIVSPSVAFVPESRPGRGQFRQFIERASPIRKKDPVFGALGSCVSPLKKAGVGLLCLANNHVMDHGAAGLRYTREVCRQAGIAIVGAGESLKEAGQPFVREGKGLRVAVLAVAKREFSIGGDDQPGANPVDLIEITRLARA